MLHRHRIDDTLIDWKCCCVAIISGLILNLGLSSAGADMFLATATVRTTNETVVHQSGPFAEVFVSNTINSNNGDAYSLAGGSYSELLRQSVLAKDADNISISSWQSRALGSFRDLILWNGSAPAPTSLFMEVWYEGSFNYENFGGSGSSYSQVNVDQNGLYNRGGMSASLGVSGGNVTEGENGTNITQSLFDPELYLFTGRRTVQLFKDTGSDSYNFRVNLETFAEVNELFIEANVMNTLGLGDITLMDGTSVIEQVSLASGLTPQVNPPEANPVPEPTSMALFGLGTAGFGVLLRRRRSSFS